MTLCPAKKHPMEWNDMLLTRRWCVIRVGCCFLSNKVQQVNGMA